MTEGQAHHASQDTQSYAPYQVTDSVRSLMSCTPESCFLHWDGTASSKIRYCELEPLIEARGHSGSKDSRQCSAAAVVIQNSVGPPAEEGTLCDL